MRDVISAVAGKTGLEKGIVQAVIAELKTYIGDRIVAGIDVDMGSDFGRFTSITRKPRSFFIPPTGETVAVGERRKMRFVPSAKRLKTLSPVDCD